MSCCVKDVGPISTVGFLLTNKTPLIMGRKKPALFIITVHNTMSAVRFYRAEIQFCSKSHIITLDQRHFFYQPNVIAKGLFDLGSTSLARQSIQTQRNMSTISNPSMRWTNHWFAQHDLIIYNSFKKLMYLNFCECLCYSMS